MIIGINILYWVPDTTGGTQRYLLELLKYYQQHERDHEFIIFANISAMDRLKAVVPEMKIVVPPKSKSSRLSNLVAEYFWLPKAAKSENIDVMHSIGYLSPKIKGVATVATVHDMIHYHYPDEIPYLKRILWKLLFPASLKNLSHIIAISGRCKEDIVTFDASTKKKITIVHHGIDSSFKPAESVNHKENFILSVSSVVPHKNMALLIKAFAKCAKELPDTKLKLVGMETPTTRVLMHEAENAGVKDKVVFTGRVSDAELLNLYQTARLFVFPSLYEGFGFPPLEAMACGCPVASSNLAPMTELLGEHAVYFDPHDPSELAEILTNELEKEIDLLHVKAAAQHVKTFQWSETAVKTICVYKAFLKQG